MCVGLPPSSRVPFADETAFSPSSLDSVSSLLPPLPTLPRPLWSLSPGCTSSFGEPLPSQPPLTLTRLTSDRGRKDHAHLRQASASRVPLCLHLRSSRSLLLHPASKHTTDDLSLLFLRPPSSLRRFFPPFFLLRRTERRPGRELRWSQQHRSLHQEGDVRLRPLDLFILRDERFPDALLRFQEPRPAPQRRLRRGLSSCEPLSLPSSFEVVADKF